MSSPDLRRSSAEQRRAALTAVAPGTELRDGLERILRGSTGALIVLGYDECVAELCSGGFELQAGFAATRLRELAKMDGAIVLDATASTILRAAVQLVPDPALPTGESGTRHRTAERVAAQTGYPVISVSKSMRIIAVYIGGARYVLEESTVLLSRAHQALATLERYKQRQDQVTGALSALEIEDLVTVRDVIAAVQRTEMVRRIADDIEGHLIELGTDGRLLALQLDELVAGTADERRRLIQDYVPASPAAGAGPGPEVRDQAVAAVMAALSRLGTDELLDAEAMAAVLGLDDTGGEDGLDAAVSPHGYRQLARVPRLPGPAADRLIRHFGGLQKLLAASVADLEQVEGLGPAAARGVREGISRLAESSLVERYS